MMYSFYQLVVAGVLRVAGVSITTKTADDTGVRYTVPYILKGLDDVTPYISLSFNLDRVGTSGTLQLILEKYKNRRQSYQVFMAEPDNTLRDISMKQLNKSGGLSNDDCTEYRGIDPRSSYSIHICMNGAVRKGVIVRSHDYFILHTTDQTIDKSVVVEHYISPITSDHVIKNLVPPKVNFSRVKRTTGGNDQVDATVEVAIFTEHLLFKQFCQDFSPLDTKCTEGINQLNDYISTLVLGADLYFDRIDYPEFRISLDLRAIIHNARDIDDKTKEEQSLFYDIQTISTSGQPMVDSAQSISRFSRYQNAYLNQPGKKIPTDHVSLLTLHGLLEDLDAGFATIGVAYVGGICDNLFRSSICQHKPAYGAIYILAHEIGHNLGAVHDGKYKECPAEDNFIMATHNLMINQQNMFYFSCCSQAEMYYKIQETGSCLEWKEENDDILVFREKLPGVKYNRTLQCHSVFNSNHTPCTRETINEYKVAMGHDECEAHWCFDVNAELCKMSQDDPVLAGTSCFDDHWCIEGKCIPTTKIIAGQGQPTCDFSTLQLSANHGEKEDSDKSENLWSGHETSEIIARGIGLFFGLGLFILGGVFVLLRRRGGMTEPPSVLADNHSRLSRLTNMTINVPAQYDAILDHRETPQYNIADYHRKVEKFLSSHTNTI